MKKIATVCLVSILALVLIAPGYAFWSDVSVIDFDVETGHLEVVLKSHGANDYGPDPTWRSGPNPGGLDIGHTKCADAAGVGELDGVAYSGSLLVDICGYPSYAPTCTFEVINSGSIPAKLDKLKINWHGELADAIRVGRWSVEYPGGYMDKGRGFRALQRAIRGAALETGEKMWLNVEFRVCGHWSREKNGVDFLTEAFNKMSILAVAEAADQAVDSDTSAEQSGDSDGAANHDSSDTRSSAETGNPSGNSSQSGSDETCNFGETSDSDTSVDAGDNSANDSHSADGNQEWDNSQPLNGTDDTPVPEPENEQTTDADSEPADDSGPVSNPGSGTDQENNAGEDGSADLPTAPINAPPVESPATGGGGEGGAAPGGGSGSPDGDYPQIQCGFATGTVTITYKRWNCK